MADLMERVKARLAGARSALGEERARLAQLNAERIGIYVSRNGDRDSRLQEIDARLLECQNTVGTLQAITSGLEPKVEAVLNTQAEIGWGANELERARAMVEAYRHYATVCDLMRDVAAELRKAESSFRAAGHRLTPSGSDLLKLAEGRWQGRLRHEATSMIAAHSESLIPRLQRDIKDSQERLQSALGELTEEARS